MSDSHGIEPSPSARRWSRAALEMAREAHAGQTRNASGGRPYIDHPVAVAEHLAEHGSGDEVLAAALLHDVVEDTELEVEDIARALRRAGRRDRRRLTDDESIEPYEERKGEHRDRVEAAGDGRAGDLRRRQADQRRDAARRLRRARARRSARS